MAIAGRLLRARNEQTAVSYQHSAISIQIAVLTSDR
jgi:hypothetical protein